MYLNMKIYNQGNLTIEERGEKICIFIEDTPLNPATSQIGAVDTLYSLKDKGCIPKKTLNESVSAINQKSTIPVAINKREKSAEVVVTEILKSAEILLLAETALIKGHYSIEPCNLIFGGHRLVGPNCIGKPRFNSTDIESDIYLAFTCNMIDEKTLFSLIEEVKSLFPKKVTCNKKRIGNMVLGESVGDCYYKTKTTRKTKKKSRVYIN